MLTRFIGGIALIAIGVFLGLELSGRLTTGQDQGSTAALDSAQIAAIEERLAGIEVRLGEVAEGASSNGQLEIRDVENALWSRLKEFGTRLDGLSTAVDSINLHPKWDQDNFDGHEIEPSQPSAQRIAEEASEKLAWTAKQSQWDDALSREQIDPEWSNATVAMIEESFVFEPELAGAKLVDAQCAASLCRIEVVKQDFEGTFDSSDLSELEDEMLFMWSDELPSGAISIEEDAFGIPRIVVYFARQGETLP